MTIKCMISDVNYVPNSYCDMRNTRVNTTGCIYVDVCGFELYEF